jgi:hypothetical protein
VEGFVSSIVYEKLMVYFEEHPAEAKNITLKSIMAARSREAARKARELTRRKSVLESGSLPGKLADCTLNDPEKTESSWWTAILQGHANKADTENFRPFCTLGKNAENRKGPVIKFE